MLDAKNAKLLVEIALNSETVPSTRISACSLIYKCSLLPASDVLSILEDTIGDYRCKDGNKVKALELMDKIDNSQSNEKSIESTDVAAVEKQLMEQYLDVPTHTSSGEVQEQAGVPEI
jgi:hypothetical protein